MGGGPKCTRVGVLICKMGFSQLKAHGTRGCAVSIQGSASTRRAALTAPPATPAYRAPVSSTGKVRQAPGGRRAQVWTTVVQCTRTGLGKSAAGARLALHSPGGRVSSVGGARSNTRLQPTRCARPRTAALACPRAQTEGCPSSPSARSARLKRNRWAVYFIT